MEIGLSITRAREAAGISVHELAARIGVTSVVLSRLERGLAILTASQAQAIAAAISISLDDLLLPA